MERIIVEFINHLTGQAVDLAVPTAISGRALVEALDSAYELGLMSLALEQRYVQAEHPVALVRGEASLAELGLRDGSILHFTPRRNPLDE